MCFVLSFCLFVLLFSTVDIKSYGVRTVVCPVDKQTWRFLRRVYDATSVQREYTGRGSDLAVVVPEQNEMVARGTPYRVNTIMVRIAGSRVYGGKGAELLLFFKPRIPRTLYTVGYIHRNSKKKND